MSTSTGAFLLGAMTGATVISLGTWAVMNRTFVKFAEAVNQPTFLPMAMEEEEEVELGAAVYDTCGDMFEEDDRAVNTAHRTVGK